MEEAQWCSGAASLLLAQGDLNLCRVPWNLKTIEAFCVEMCCPVTESLVLVAGYGSCNRVVTQNTTTKNTPERPRTKPSMSYITFVEGAATSWRRRPSNLRQLERSAHEARVKIPGRQVEKSYWELNKWPDFRDCLKGRSGRVGYHFLSRPVSLFGF